MDDYISREAALNFEMEIEADPDEIQAITKGMALYADYIKTVPAADVVKRKRGYNAKADYPSLFECSLCGWSDYDTMTGDSIEYNYCPNCGADMRGEDDV